MKKILLTSLAALALASCVSDNDLNPAAEEQQYGYINLSVSSDPIVVTRADENIKTITDLSEWTVGTQKYSGNGYADEVTFSTKLANNFPLEAGFYKVNVSNYPTEADAHAKNEGWGLPYYLGNTQNNVEVIGGAKTSVSIDCGKAQNARLSVDFALDNASLITSCQLKITKEGDETSSRNIVFKDGTKEYGGTEGEFAYFTANQAIGYELSYIPGGEASEEKRLTYNGSVNMDARATTKTISVTTGDNGTINITVTVDETFESGGTQTITIDATSGEEVDKGTFKPTVTPES